MSEKNTAAYWAAIKKGDMLALTDERTMIEQMKAKKGVSPIPVPATGVVNVRIMSPSRRQVGQYFIIMLGDQRPWLVAKIVGDEFSLTTYWSAPDWQPATRKELMGKDCTFLFQDPGPDRGEGWEQKLRYVEEISHDATGVKYAIKPQGELTGEMQPHASSIRQFATVVEYLAQGKTGDPEMAIFEIGEGNSGLIHIMLGRQVTSSDVDVVKR